LAKTKSSSSYSSDPSADPSAPTTAGTVADLDKAIAAHQQLLREIPFRVLQPLADAALQRIREKASELAISEAVSTPPIVSSTLGQTVTINNTGESAVILQSSLQSHSPEELYHVVLTASGKITTVKASDVSQGPFAGAAPSTPAITPTGQEAAPTAPASVAGITPPFQPGESVTSPVGTGRIVRLSSANPEMYEVTNSHGESFFFPRDALRAG
jgi:hypothetical protein